MQHHSTVIDVSVDRIRLCEKSGSIGHVLSTARRHGKTGNIDHDESTADKWCCTGAAIHHECIEFFFQYHKLDVYIYADPQECLNGFLRKDTL